MCAACFGTHGYAGNGSTFCSNLHCARSAAVSRLQRCTAPSARTACRPRHGTLPSFLAASERFVGLASCGTPRVSWRTCGQRCFVLSPGASHWPTRSCCRRSAVSGGHGQPLISRVAVRGTRGAATSSGYCRAVLRRRALHVRRMSSIAPPMTVAIPGFCPTSSDGGRATLSPRAVGIPGVGRSGGLSACTRQSPRMGRISALSVARSVGRTSACSARNRGGPDAPATPASLALSTASTSL
mmetsp:Transcript_7439/g.18492  ORF Transcript_7439/g.18492 Transcript_7439/m.18492 type:complete len:241 (+) Transcript_7439:317-1039(+)